MNKYPPIVIPKGIRYLSDWKEFSLPDHPCIIDKKLTGCGFTEYVIREPFNAVLISPRKTLLENKVDQHNPKLTLPSGEKVEITNQRVIYYARTDEPDLGVDKDLQATKPKESKDNLATYINIAEFRENLKEAINTFWLIKKPIKICVTYDSFRKVKEILEELKIIDSFYFVVDEFQSIFTDSKFKSGTELEFVTVLRGLQKVSFVSATPMMEEYLDLLEDFKYLPYYELDWESEDPNRIISPEIIAKGCDRINEVAKRIITEFKEGKYQRKTLVDKYGKPIQIVEGKELIFYVNSVKNIADIIRQNKLTYEEVNIICAKTSDNSKKIRDAFKAVYKELGRNIKEIPKEKDIIGSVPVPDSSTGEVYNKPITLCTKTVYLGADFYSKCARSIVLSDSTTECLAVDITLDLPQILGRQRDLDNPWKNSLEIWFRAGYGAKDISPEEFQSLLKKKETKTINLLNLYNKGEGEEKHDLAEEFEKTIKRENYRDHYVAVNRHGGSDLIPQFNNLVMIAEKRAFDIQQKDYKDRFTVFNRIQEVFGESTIDLSKDLQYVIDCANKCKHFPEKMKIYCDWVNSVDFSWCNYLPEPFRTYIQTLGIDFIVTSSYRKYNLDEAMVKRGIGRIFSKEDLDELVLGYFEVGKKYTKSQIKQDLLEIYNGLGIPGKPKASDLEQWFELKAVKITNNETGKRDHGFEIIKQK